MKWVELLVIIHGVFLIGLGVLAALLVNPTGGIVLIVVGVVFLCALIFRRQIARSIQRVGKYLWPS